MPLMTHEEYEKTQHETPYTYVIRSGTAVLYFFGERHSFNPDDEQWVKVRVFWNSFIAETEGKKRIFFIEGGVRKNEEDEIKAILEQGGLGLVTYLAHKDNVEIYSPEPDASLERIELEKGFSKEEIQYYYFARVAYQWGKIPDPKPDFESYIGKYLKRDKDESNWNVFDFSLEAMKKIHTAIFGTVFDEHDNDFLYSIINPIDQNTVINKVSRRSGEIRDMHIAEEIRKYMKNGYSIYAQFGAHHAVVEEPLLKEILL